MKPNDISQEAWEEARGTLHPVMLEHYHASPVAMVMHVEIARAIQRAVERERESCAQTCLDYRYEHKIVGERYAAAIRARGK